MWIALIGSALAGLWDDYMPEPRGAWVALSHDGEQLAWIDPHASPQRVVIAPTENESDSTVVAEAPPEAKFEQLAWVSADQLAVAIVSGDERRAWVVEVTDGSRWPLGEGIAVGVLSHTVLMDHADGKGRALAGVDLHSRDRTVLARSQRTIDAWYVDETGAPVGAMDRTWRNVRAEDGSTHRFLKRWEFLGPDEDVLASGGRHQGYPNDGRFWLPNQRAVDRSLIVVDGRRERDTDAVLRWPLDGGEPEVLFESPGPDVEQVLVAKDGRLLAVAIEGARTRWHALDPEVAADFERLNALGVDFFVTSPADSPRWLLHAWTSTLRRHQLVYDRRSGEIWRVGLHWGAVEDRPWRPKEPLEFPASDGLPLTAYLTTPEGEGPHPLVVYVHGGPWPWRDRWTFEPMVLRFAERGYAVLQVNFRGSDGLGNAFQEAWRGEWGGKMQTDLYDALDHVIATGRVDPERVAFVGASYGGYATLAAMTQIPERIRCGVAEAAPALLRPLTLRLRDHVFHTFIDTRKKRLERSPSRNVEALAAPVLMIHGGRDTAVPVRNALPFAKNAAAAGKDVTFVLFPEDGHGPVADANQAAWLALTDAFLARCLGGEPVDLQGALEGVRHEVRFGGDWIR